MKTKLFLLMLSIAGIVTAFVFENSSKVENEATTRTSLYTLPNNNITNNFLVGSLHSVTDPAFTNVNDLGLNMWHTYTGGEFDAGLQRWVPTGWTTADKLTADIITYRLGVTGILNGIHNNNGMRSLMQRPKN